MATPKMFVHEALQHLEDVSQKRQDNADGTSHVKGNVTTNQYGEV